jgi:hypothetical protein
MAEPRNTNPTPIKIIQPQVAQRQLTRGKCESSEKEPIVWKCAAKPGCTYQRKKSYNSRSNHYFLNFNIITHHLLTAHGIDFLSYQKVLLLLIEKYGVLNPQYSLDQDLSNSRIWACGECADVTEIKYLRKGRCSPCLLVGLHRIIEHLAAHNIVFGYFVPVSVGRAVKVFG